MQFRPVGLSLVTMQNFLAMLREWILTLPEGGDRNLTEIINVSHGTSISLLL